MHLVAIGGSDAGISAALRARELDPSVDVTVVVADAYPNFSICGIPYYFSGEVAPWQSLAHRTHADLEATGMNLRLNTFATSIDVAGQQLAVRDETGQLSNIAYDELIVGTGALPSYAGIMGLDELTPEDGVHVIHSMGDTFALERFLTERGPKTAIIIGAGYVGLEMAEGFTARGIRVTQLQRGPEVLSTLDPELGALVHSELTDHGVEVHTDTVVHGVEKSDSGLTVHAERGGIRVTHSAEVILAVVGVRPNTTLLADAGATLGPAGAVSVDAQMRTGLPHVFAAGDGVATHHRLLGLTYLPLGTTAHKQGRVAGENALGGQAQFAGSVGTQVVKVFDLVASRTGLRHDEAAAAGFTPLTTQAIADDHKRYYPGAQPISIRITGDAGSGQLLGAQLVGRLGTETAKRVDTYATALFAGLTVEQVSDLDLSYTPPLGSPWDAVQVATQAWSRAAAAR
ncbi:NADPH-dependent 2,4-dienoyl-CoA reductase/sulfur reductase-like enzyme [Microbacterium endophyticum]|uniref:NADPH-dependent 2,4-dienoyl-CoA reductase/sulfur reductase-like enzyme n=1 Tax=Microbacterium endophyticum TaxID=1526412 RepID=A0A7W4V2H2_9MICO|nr:FAD-dependent oxidoreductase [Microbacterium endophyticum]MBB2975591.1 NADPH-dependent 2,4-dienoyl-CoA reductase/sulfur reductase-like enzyme [Microbacterium endophyticum]NIK35390.1 NADPH-dependent 2,4-dienoyl-CoA reductase/sulfur reductase-like enzyme [Microbacterium endophyticum]